MSQIIKMAREPLVQFLLIGVAIFMLYTLTDRGQIATRDQIVVTEGRVQQLAQVFTKTWQRQPTPHELHGLIEAYIKEEVYYREALNLSLDRDDTLIRRRMQQKMEFLTEPPEGALRAADAELEAYLEASRADFRVAPRIAFHQLLIKFDGAEGSAIIRAAEILADIRSAPDDADLRRHGDATLLPYAVALSPFELVARNFGGAFAEKLTSLPRGEWAGPILSPYGLHLVRIDEFRDAYDPPLNEIREIVEQKWRAERRDAFVQREYERLRNKYEVVLPTGDERDKSSSSEVR